MPRQRHKAQNITAGTVNINRLPIDNVTLVNDGTGKMKAMAAETPAVGARRIEGAQQPADPNMIDFAWGNIDVVTQIDVEGTLQTPNRVVITNLANNLSSYHAAEANGYGSIVGTLGQVNRIQVRVGYLADGQPSVNTVLGAVQADYPILMASSPSAGSNFVPRSGDPNVARGTQHISSGDYGPAANLYDGNNGTYTELNSYAAGVWVGQDFGVGNEKKINRVVAEFMGDRTPARITIEASDDLLTWYDLASEGYWSVGTPGVHTFDVTAPRAYRAWRLKTLDPTGTSYYFSLISLAMYTGTAENWRSPATYGLSVTDPGQAISSYPFNAHQAFNTNLNNYWESNSSNVRNIHWIGQDFGAYKRQIRCVEIEQTLDPYYSVGLAAVEASDDGANWIQIGETWKIDLSNSTIHLPPSRYFRFWRVIARGVTSNGNSSGYWRVARIAMLEADAAPYTATDIVATANGAGSLGWSASNPANYASDDNLTTYAATSNVGEAVVGNTVMSVYLGTSGQKPRTIMFVNAPFTRMNVRKVNIAVKNSSAGAETDMGDFDLNPAGGLTQSIILPSTVPDTMYLMIRPVVGPEDPASPWGVTSVEVYEDETRPELPSVNLTVETNIPSHAKVSWSGMPTTGHYVRGMAATAIRILELNPDGSEYGHYDVPLTVSGNQYIGTYSGQREWAIAHANANGDTGPIFKKVTPPGAVPGGDPITGMTAALSGTSLSVGWQAAWNTSGITVPYEAVISRGNINSPLKSQLFSTNSTNFSGSLSAITAFEDVDYYVHFRLGGPQHPHAHIYYLTGVELGQANTVGMTSVADNGDNKIRLQFTASKTQKHNYVIEVWRNATNTRIFNQTRALEGGIYDELLDIAGQPDGEYNVRVWPALFPANIQAANVIFDDHDLINSVTLTDQGTNIVRVTWGTSLYTNPGYTVTIHRATGNPLALGPALITESVPAGDTTRQLDITMVGTDGKALEGGFYAARVTNDSDARTLDSAPVRFIAHGEYLNGAEAPPVAGLAVEAAVSPADALTLLNGDSSSVYWNEGPQGYYINWGTPHMVRDDNTDGTMDTLVVKDAANWVDGHGQYDLLQRDKIYRLKAQLKLVNPGQMSETLQFSLFRADNTHIENDFTPEILWNKNWLNQTSLDFVDAEIAFRFPTEGPGAPNPAAAYFSIQLVGQENSYTPEIWLKDLKLDILDEAAVGGGDGDGGDGGGTGTYENAVPVMASNSQNGYVAGGSTAYTGYDAYRLFDQDPATQAIGYTLMPPGLTVFDLTLPAGETVDKVRLTIPQDFNVPAGAPGGFYPAPPADFTIDGSTDGGTTWIPIVTVSGKTWTTLGESQTYDSLDTTTAFTKLRIRVTALDKGSLSPDGSVLSLAELEFLQEAEAGGGGGTLAAPTNLAYTTAPLNGEDARMNLSWTDAPGAAEYEIEYSNSTFSSAGLHSVVGDKLFSWPYRQAGQVRMRALADWNVATEQYDTVSAWSPWLDFTAYSSTVEPSISSVTNDGGGNATVWYSVDQSITNHPIRFTVTHSSSNVAYDQTFMKTHGTITMSQGVSGLSSGNYTVRVTDVSSGLYTEEPLFIA